MTAQAHGQGERLPAAAEHAVAHSATPASTAWPAAGRLDGWSRAAGTVALPLLLAVSIAALAWALPGGGDSQVAVALALVGAAFVSATTVAWAIARFVRARTAEVEALREEQRALQAELAAMAHDLRAPLVTATSYFELLTEEAFGRLPSEARDAAERGRVASERAQALAESALRRAVRYAQGERSSAARVDLDAVVEDVLSGLRRDLAEANAQVEVRRLPQCVGDADALYRVFTNLIENALKYAPPSRPPRVMVSGYVEGDQVSISVRDWGIGIARREQERVFGLLERGGAEGSEVAGSGIGLATVRRLVQEQGGRVSIDPLVSDGTCVRVVLPKAA